VCLLASPATDKNQIQMFSSGIGSSAFYDPRRAMAIRAWIDGDIRLALRLLQWAQPDQTHTPKTDPSIGFQAA
jgi:hypothetical protein